MASHTAAPFPIFVKVVYALASMAFVVQGVTGVVMWSRIGRGGAHQMQRDGGRSIG